MIQQAGNALSSCTMTVPWPNKELLQTFFNLSFPRYPRYVRVAGKNSLEGLLYAGFLHAVGHRTEGSLAPWVTYFSLSQGLLPSRQLSSICMSSGWKCPSGVKLILKILWYFYLFKHLPALTKQKAADELVLGRVKPCRRWHGAGRTRGTGMCRLMESTRLHLGAC